jgi:hypothetical protein
MPRQDVRIANDGREIALYVPARYRNTMKRSTLKLVICRETVRVLAELDLGRVAGGSQDPQLMDTGGGANNTCVQVAVVVQAALPAKP